MNSLVAAMEAAQVVGVTGKGTKQKTVSLCDSESTVQPCLDYRVLFSSPHLKNRGGRTEKDSERGGEGDKGSGKVPCKE